MQPQDITKYMDAFTQGVSHMAEQLKVPAGKVFELALKQNYVNAISEAFYLILIGISWIVIYKFYQFGTKEDKNGNTFFSEHDMIPELFGPIFIIIFIAISIVLVLLLPTDILSRLINPQWSTIQDIINLVKNGK